MGILNNIWVAISTPNLRLINILIIPLIFLEGYLTMCLFLNIIKVDVSSNRKILYTILISIVALITGFLIPEPFNVFLNYFTIIFLTVFIIKLSVLKSFICIVSSAIIFGIVGFLIANPYMTILHISSDELSTIPIYRLGYLICMYLTITFIILILKNKDFKLTLLDSVDIKNKILILFNLLLGIFTLILHSILTFYYIDTLPITITLLSFVALLAYLSISIYSLTRVTKLTLTTRKLESAEAYNHTLHILHDNVRGFKHDFDNIVTTIGGYIKTEDMEGLKKYYVQLEDDCQRVNNLYILNPDVVNNNGIYNLLTKKYHEADSKDIKVNISFLLDLNTLHMKIYEFARILGILLDNAIEASSECEEKLINIIFRNDSKNSRQLIIVENTYKNKDIDTEKIFEKGISGKENHTGLGLWEVRKLIKKNNNINLYTSKTDKLFCQQLEIYY